MLIALGVACLVLLGCVAWLFAERRRLAAELESVSKRAQVLESDLDAALRPGPASHPAERAFRRVISGASRTANRVREHGVSGLMQSVIDDIQTWAADERADILTMAAPDGTVTLMFSDIEDSTALNDRLGDGTFVKVLAAHDQILRARIGQYRGQVVKTQGDGFMVAFRDTEAACRTALKIQKDLARSLDPALRRHGPVQVRIGIHTGQVVAKDGDYFGRNVAMAARVASLASGGDTFASDAVREALDADAAVALDEIGEVELKGLSGAHRIWRVLPPA